MPDGGDPSKSDRMRFAAVFGHPHTFSYQTRYTRFAGVWLPGHLQPKYSDGDVSIVSAANQRGSFRPRPIENRWVYVFAFVGATFKPTWLAETWVDGKGRVLFNPNGSFDDRLEWDKQDDVVGWLDAVSDPRVHELESKVNGRARHYWFVGSRHRLSNDALKQFEKEENLYFKVRTVDVSNQNSFVKNTKDQTSIPVDCPVDVAIQLHRDIAANRTERMRASGIGTGKSAPTADMKEENWRYQFSKHLEALTKNEDIYDEIDDDFHPNRGRGEPKMKLFNKIHEMKLDGFHLLAENSMADLCHWMERFLFRIVTEGVQDKTAEEHIMIDDFERCTNLLATGAPGVAFLNAFADRTEKNKQLPLYGYVFDPEPSAKFVTGMSRIVAGKLFGIMGAFTASRLQNLQVDADLELQRFLKHIKPRFLPAVPFGLETSTKMVEHIIDGKFVDKSAKGKLLTATTEITYLKTRRENLAKLENGLGKAQKVIHALDFINLLMVARAWLDVPENQEKRKQEQGLIFAVTALQAISSLWKYVAEKNLKYALESGASFLARVFGAVVFIITFSVDAVNLDRAIAKSDYDAAVALAVAMGAGTLQAIVSFALAVEAGFAVELGPVGILLFVVTAAATILYYVLKDTELETFVTHCSYGRYADADNDDTETWTTVALKDLKNSWLDQSKALTALTCGFRLRPDGPSRVIKLDNGKDYVCLAPSVYIDLGAVDEETRFHIKWWWQVDRQTDWSKSERQYWTALKRHENSTHTFTNKSKWMIHAPHRALRDCFEADPGGPAIYRGNFKTLWVGVQKIVKRRTQSFGLPFNGAHGIYLVKDGKSLPNSTWQLSLDYSGYADHWW